MPRLALLIISIFVVPTMAQVPVPEADAFRERRTRREPIETRLAAAERLMKKGQFDLALRTLRDASPWLAGDAIQRLDIVRCGQEADLAALGLDRFELAMAHVDARGRLPRDRKVEAALGDDHEQMRALVEARARAVLAFIAFAAVEAKPKDGINARLLARDLLERSQRLAMGSPALEKLVHKAFKHLEEPELPDVKGLLRGLKRAMDRALGKGEFGRAILLAQTLGAIATQAGFDDLEGPKAPNLRAAGMAARAGLRRAREGLESEREGELLTVADLEGMDEEERAAFDRRHATWANPGVARSETGLYRIETICGHATLLGTARTVERHHRRLVAWYGHDPFEGRPGLVRIVPRSSGLEQESTPYWWAQGFQRGDETVIKFSAGRIEGLGRTLTHELTHRFDGAVYGGFPGWLSEGRAVWTGSAYGHSTDKVFVDRHLNIGTVERTYIQGYAGKKALEDLIRGTLDDYRDNYFAGYALWMYISAWREGNKDIFGKPLLAYLKKVGRVRGEASIALFVRHFADGRGGRPKGLDEFVVRWREYLKGHHWQSRADWLSNYTTRVVRRFDPYVYDGATWHRDRVRSEPWLGQDHALRAARLLREAGDEEAAAIAFAWAAEGDELRPSVAEEVAAALDASGERHAAWAVLVRSLRRFGRPELPKAPSGQSGISSSLKALAGLVGGLPDHLSRVAFAQQSDLAFAGLGYRPRTEAEFSPRARPAETTRGLDPAPVHLGAYGWVEDGLSGYEQRRVKDLWFDDDEGSLTVGRKRPREGTGSRDQRAHQRDAFARSRYWIAPGRYALTVRIHATTSYISGSIVIGYTRRDRNTRVRFSAGDFLFSVGAKEESARFDKVGVSVDGLHEREGGLRGAEPRQTVKLRNVGSSFLVHVQVDGPELTAIVDGKVVGSYHTPDGRPIEGYLGLASGQGAFRASTPLLERFDRRRDAGQHADWPVGLTTHAAGSEPASTLRNRRTEGFVTGAKGTIVVFIPAFRAPLAEDDEQGEGELLPSAALAERGIEQTIAVHRILVATGLRPRLVVALPHTVMGDDRKHIARTLAREAPLAEVAVYHHWRKALDFQPVKNKPPRPRASVLFLDPLGVLRAHGRARSQSLPGTVQHQARVFGNRKEHPGTGQDQATGPR